MSSKLVYTRSLSISSVVEGDTVRTLILSLSLSGKSKRGWVRRGWIRN